LDSHVVPYKLFLATLLLPCNSTQAVIQKFTGNDLLGQVGHNDKLSMAIHVFMHFLWVYSHDYMIFCDLQGETDVGDCGSLSDCVVQNLCRPSQQEWSY
jgi:hypothetical protein